MGLTQNLGLLSTSIKATSTLNVGIGTIPKGIGSTRTLEIGSRGAFYDNNDNFAMVNNAWNDGTWKYKETGTATLMTTNGGDYAFLNAASGTQNNAITWNERMRITSSGNILMGGTADQSQRLQVYGDVLFEKATGNTSLLMKRITNDTKFEISVQETRTRIRTWSTANDRDIFFDTDNAGTTRMVITGGGTVCVNSTSGYSSEKMRIAVAGSGYCLQLSDTTNTSWQVFQGFNASGGDLGSIQRNGGSLAVLYNTSSDIRLKENILDAESALDKISKIKVRQFDWIGCNMHQEYGFIAQELNEVYPEVVNSQTKTWGVDYGKLTPILLKAIQELKAEIDALKNK
jgi:hypothetical protein